MEKRMEEQKHLAQIKDHEKLLQSVMDEQNLQVGVRFKWNY